MLGFAGIDNQGLEGIEYSYDEILKGVDGSIVTECDSNNNIIQQAIQEYNQPQDGYNIYLTIDENIQYFAERELDNLMNSETPPKAAAVLAMNPKQARFWPGPIGQPMILTIIRIMMTAIVVIC